MVPLLQRGAFGLELGDVARPESPRRSARAAGVLPSRIIVDGRPAPSLSTSVPVAMSYCDNGNIIGTCKEDVERVVTSVMAELRNMRLDLQDITGAALDAESLGVYVDGRRGLVRPLWRRLSKVVAACDFMSRRPNVTSKQLERLAGCITYISLLHRPLLSLLNAVYGFIHRGFVMPTRVWPSVARELWNCRCLLPLARAQLTLPVQPSVFATDASLAGMGVCCTEWDAGEAQAVGRWSERFRFKRIGGERRDARAQALMDTDVVVKKVILDTTFEDTFIDSTRDASAVVPVEDFPSIPFELVDKRWWQLFQSRWSQAEAIHVLEARGVWQHCGIWHVA